MFCFNLIVLMGLICFIHLLIIFTLLMIIDLKIPLCHVSFHFHCESVNSHPYNNVAISLSTIPRVSETELTHCRHHISSFFFHTDSLLHLLFICVSLPENTPQPSLSSWFADPPHYLSQRHKHTVRWTLRCGNTLETGCRTKGWTG